LAGKARGLMVVRRPTSVPWSGLIVMHSNCAWRARGREPADGWCYSSVSRRLDLQGTFNRFRAASRSRAVLTCRRRFDDSGRGDAEKDIPKNKTLFCIDGKTQSNLGDGHTHHTPRRSSSAEMETGRVLVRRLPNGRNPQHVIASIFPGIQRFRDKAQRQEAQQPHQGSPGLGVLSGPHEPVRRRGNTQATAAAYALPVIRSKAQHPFGCRSTG
jgi:hypothetical protein